ncbi:4Fe-4S binding protein [Methanococcus voltae]|uniref:4Fe-4S ferredoxin iron-sulfur binding domain protein n=1 Tax=Methanococcus voltae (strain ATCC BAA-1334 / A3) TaxID=456320 RepID=D7DRT3_METV3|nr:4Fe-4S binding protein [Methanococcus voltae]MCS3901161.1 polyferredoxin [Methanococcus voltae]
MDLKKWFNKLSKNQKSRLYIQLGALIPLLALGMFGRMVVLILLFPFMLLLGPVWCGWICPMGTLHRISGLIGKKIFGNKHNNFISTKTHEKLKYVKYLMLFAMIGFAGYYMLVLNGSVDFLITLFMITVAIGVILSLFNERVYCRYLCPAGAMLGLTNLIKSRTIKRDANVCVNCSKCDKSCPMGIKVSKTAEIRNVHCISCNACVDSCPKDNAMIITWNKSIKSIKSMKKLIKNEVSKN